MSNDIAHMDSCWCPNCLGQSIDEVRTERDNWAAIAERLYDIMLAHETVSDDDWNQGLEDCHKLMIGATNG